MTASFLDYDRLRKAVLRHHPDIELEIRDGEYVVVVPHDPVSANIVIRLGELLNAWVRPRGLGYVLDSNGAFVFPDGDRRSPDVSFVSKARVPSLPRTPQIAAIPELVAEVRSCRQTERAVRNQVESLVEKGCSVGLLVDPDRRCVEVYRALRRPQGDDGGVVVLNDGDELTVPEVLPGFSVRVEDIWPD